MQQRSCKGKLECKLKGHAVRPGRFSNDLLRWASRTAWAPPPPEGCAAGSVAPPDLRCAPRSPCILELLFPWCFGSGGQHACRIRPNVTAQAPCHRCVCWLAVCYSDKNMLVVYHAKHKIYLKSTPHSCVRAPWRYRMHNAIHNCDHNAVHKCSVVFHLPGDTLTTLRS
jgi:hypothetical protein